ncbi:MAG: hypothetical protein LBH57_00420 [Treponema sp.]|jgi:hypothetical protein|nr:hypothetical protein [Treponema sp.]
MAYDELFLTPEDRDCGEGGSFGAELLRSLPVIRRARDFRLYTGDGRRLTDLWQYGGRAVLGHTPPNVLRELKNAASRGIFVPFPSHYEGRFVKALSRLFPGRIIRIYAGDASLRRALSRAGYDGAASFPDPAFPASPSDPPVPGKLTPVLWRPFLEDPLQPPPEPGAAAPVMVPVLPLPWAGVPRVLILDGTWEAAFPAAGQDRISPVVLAAVTRSVWDLIAALPERGRRKFPRLRKALARSPWRRRGIYLTLAGPVGEEAYAALFRCFLEKGFLPPPSPRCPLILPGELSPGEEAALASCLQS